MKIYKYGIQLFDGKYTKYGGHWQKLSRLTGLDYFDIYFNFGFKYFSDYYDGYHSTIGLGIIWISWGGRPLHRDNYH